MKIVFATRAWDDYLWWQRKDRRGLERVNTLIRDIQRDPQAGIGKPERLAHGLAGLSSRRIDREHRIVYRVEGDALLIVQLRFHY